MTLQEAMTWIDAQRQRDPLRITAFMTMSGEVWLSSSTGDVLLVLHSDDEGACNRLLVDLKEYLRLTERAHV